jgi:hypothetical protein
MLFGFAPLLLNRGQLRCSQVNFGTAEVGGNPELFK